MRASAIAALATLLSASIARADAVMPPPTECPRGATGVSSHAGPHCAPTTCTVASECTAMEREVPLECVEAGLCVATREGFGGWTGAFEYEEALGACHAQSDCADGSTCETAMRCAPRQGGPVWALWLAGGAAIVAIGLIAAMAFVFTRRSRRSGDRIADPKRA